MANADRDRAYVNDNITFSSHGSLGDIQSYQWNFSDGNLSALPNPVHSFEKAGWYNVSLRILARDGRIAGRNLTIGIQRTNLTNERDSGRLVDLRRGTWTGQGFQETIGPNGCNPNISYDALLVQPIGSFRVEISVMYQVEENFWHNEYLYTDEFTLKGQDYVFSYDVAPDRIPCNCSVNESEFEAVIWAKTGTWKSTRMAISIGYSLEGMVPPDS
jgi:hypothetical protein